MSTNNKKNSAYEYVDNGWNIFPITNGEKTPLSAALTGGSQNSTLETPLNDDDVERIWGEYPDANIGAHTGAPSQIAVIDIDIAKTEDEVKGGKRTAEQATELAKHLIAIFGETRVHQSPSGGYHLVYRYTPLCEGIGRKIDAFKSIQNKHAFNLTEDSSPVDLANIDILAGNGYIVLPPSTIGENNYELLHEIDGADLPDFPDELIRLIGRRDKTSKTYFDLKDGTAAKIPTSNGKELKVIKSWDAGGKQKLNTKLQQYMGAGSGTRHDTLMKVCGTIFSFLPYSEWDTATKYVDMTIATFNPPYMRGSKAEIEADKREIRNAHDYAKAHEYAERMYSSKKDQETLNERIERDLGEIKSMGGDVSEDQYKEAVARVFELFQTNEKGEPIPNDYNVAIILSEHPKYTQRIRFDTFMEQMTYKCRIGIRYEDHYLEDNKNNPAMARLLQDIQFDFFPRVSRSAVYSAAVSVGHDEDYDSYREEMDNLIGKWDGEERMHLWLHEMFNVPDNMYYRGVAAQFVFAMVRRAYEPGAEYQKVLFLSGEQGVGKSYSMSILAGGTDRYLEFSDGLEGREFHLHSRGRTLIDLSEGESMQRSSIKRIKALITDPSGTHRTFGSGEVKQHPVRFVMAITNNHSPLVDNTGNRRFLVVDVPLAENVVGNYTWLRTYRGQIFAEAVHKYHEMKKMKEEVAQAIAVAEEEVDPKKLEALYKKEKALTVYEVSLEESGVTYSDEEEDMKKFVSPYGVPYIPQEVAAQKQAEKRMRSPIENEILAVFMSYDEYRAGHKNFFITTEEVVEQLGIDVVRQSRMGGFLNSEVGRLLKIVDERLESYRNRSGQHGQQRGVKFMHPFEGSQERLDALKALRKRAKAMKPLPPSVFGGGSKAVTLEQKAAKIRYEREGDAYLVIKDEDIQTEINVPSSVDVEDLIKQDDF